MDSKLAMSYDKPFQSTHPRGVRQWSFVFTSLSLLFQSTHPRGVRLLPNAATAARDHFNPRTRVGCDYATNGYFKSWDISIHAPAWGATCALICTNCSASNFNPRTRVGCDVPISAELSDALKFQSTHPRGVRRRLIPALLHRLEFQSTHPRGVRRFPC